VASGLPADRFFFQGFLPHKKGRQTRLSELAQLPYTFVLYESPHRLVKCLEQLIEHCGVDRPAAIGRELTKVHEEVISGTLGELSRTFQERKVRGEFVVIVGGKAY
jgi:16S rRNA (cytidine1402-2'-O)-methyltransferase